MVGTSTRLFASGDHIIDHVLVKLSVRVDPVEVLTVITVLNVIKS